MKLVKVILTEILDMKLTRIVLNGIVRLALFFTTKYRARSFSSFATKSFWLIYSTGCTICKRQLLSIINIQLSFSSLKTINFFLQSHCQVRVRGHFHFCRMYWDKSENKATLKHHWKASQYSYIWLHAQRNV